MTILPFQGLHQRVSTDVYKAHASSGMFYRYHLAQLYTLKSACLKQTFGKTYDIIILITYARTPPLNAHAGASRGLRSIFVWGGGSTPKPCVCERNRLCCSSISKNTKIKYCNSI